MANILTSAQFRTARQKVQNRYVKIELLNYKFQTVDTLEGKCINGSITIDANSDIRRTGNITLIVNDSSFDVEVGGKIWLDKFLRIWVGTYSIFSEDISWTNCGLFIIDAPNYHYDISSNTLSITLLDLMAKMTGIRNGYLKGVPISFKAGESIRKAIIGVLEYAGFKNYIVNDPPAPGVIPFDLDFGQGATVYDLLKGLLDIYPNYEMFFDENGTFIYQPIPTGLNESVSVDDSLWESIVISEDTAVDFQNVKNSIEVYGRIHDPSYFSTETTVVDNVINLKVKGIQSYSEDLIYGFTLTDNPGYSNFSLRINDLPILPVTLDDGVSRVEIAKEAGEVYYCVQKKNGYWNWLGHLQAYAEIEDTNPNSPFYVNGTVGRIRLPLFGDIYDNIFSDDLALQRAKYELYLHSSMNNMLTLTTVPVYWLEVNLLVEYTTQRNKKKELFIIKSINMGLEPSATMTVSLMKFYPDSLI